MLVKAAAQTNTNAIAETAAIKAPGFFPAAVLNCRKKNLYKAPRLCSFNTLTVPMALAAMEGL